MEPSGKHSFALALSGIYKFGARYYDTSLGRFTQSDPSRQEKYPYAYRSCNAVNSTNPTGLVTRACAIALLETILGVAGAISAITALALSALGTGGLSLLAGGIYASTFVWNAFETCIGFGDAVRNC
ncbi:RHS repeat-associated core domain-containing protein [uncultured Microbacterium sp.]|uniref:RHS repeat-associated core domain-containing protein n=1 Tax=uncultured Microbacterium sp. TaxID=191216 RepID=UPI0025968FAF|nr:RHS repeat-associated core domain-containing protein [uncultured Microbacterium sp.]